MARLQILAVVAVFAILANSALAQDAQEGPTDSDLKAGYCFQVVQSRTAFLCKQAVALATTVLGPLERKSCADGQNVVERLRDYLSARGYLYGPQDPLPIIIAADRGASDWKACMESASQPGTDSKTCMDRCASMSVQSGAWKSCMEACPVPETCQRVRRCSDLTFLPF
jgi:hypothetical protein